MVNYCPCLNGGTCLTVSTWCRYAGRYALTGAEHMGYTWVIDREGNVTAVDDDDAAVAWTQLAPLGNSAECPPSERPCARVRMQYPGHSTTDVYVGYLWVAGAGRSFRLREYWLNASGEAATIINTSGTVDVRGYGDAACAESESVADGYVCKCPGGVAGDHCELPHSCDEGTHSCDKTEGGICYEAGDNSFRRFRLGFNAAHGRDIHRGCRLLRQHQERCTLLSQQLVQYHGHQPGRRRLSGADGQSSWFRWAVQHPRAQIKQGCIDPGQQLQDCIGLLIGSGTTTAQQLSKCNGIGAGLHPEPAALGAQGRGTDTAAAPQLIAPPPGQKARVLARCAPKRFQTGAAAALPEIQQCAGYGQAATVGGRAGMAQ